jgi:glutamate-1-semialdehyde 2,1-aminomutase
MDETTLRVLASRTDIACVLVNPLQALHPNASAPGDAALMNSATPPSVTRERYAAWLRRLRGVCTARGIALIFDEVFLGFRLAYGGAQEYFGVQADMVTYGKTVGGGLPIGVLCGKRRFMKRFHDDRPADICFARGTFNAHPYVMGAMNEFLRRIDTSPARESYDAADAVWNGRAATLNAALVTRGLPVQVANLCSVWTIRYTVPSRYNWMFQYYLRAHGLALSWVGSGRLIFSHSYSDADFAAVAERFISAAAAMHQDGWWWHTTLTDSAITAMVFREMLAARSPLFRLLAPAVTRSAAARLDRTSRPAADEAAPGDRALDHGMGR